MITEKKIFIKIKSIKKILFYWEKSGKMEKRRSQLLDVLRSSISRMSHELKKFRKKFGKFGKNLDETNKIFVFSDLTRAFTLDSRDLQIYTIAV